MDVGVGLPTTVPGTDGGELLEFARRADRLGFSTLAVIDRLVYDNYDSLTALAAAAGVTERITLATTILIAAYQPSPALLAKQLASIDRLSGGRLVVGVAAGGRPDDFQATGVDYSRRGRILDDLLDEVKRVWAGEHELGIGPKPTAGQVPLWVGGHSRAALRRAARHGTGWIAPGGSVSAFPDLVAGARALWAEEGRTDALRIVALTYVALGADRKEKGGKYLVDYYSHIGEKAKYLAAGVIANEGRLRETIDGYAEVGCDELLLFPCTTDPDHLDLIAKVALP
ncbi:Flavin-dependent oxidoreductase, luciferase family (includes alkanesulfonate monooxygenase SsuD and methylene tetrahydromethanopterin reductase) [Amycolatopsis arida]|uniref:Flavin-dependent oxidoreductase, luciferase family (Includes alkanesulfonate monooxygenase SsuD and methylene tetrahydromethanopterin reductase) n=1 Tax=Amycolatopsis arida TaxID=587909 RepID=A0A1I5VBI0_9PSEU|nr:LLM class flavin-dependent oxidoreductase [Amycolatopsis arida]TDX91215.1 alkanesulfonate monooxygenase SsuD/methylene tetrahydromethanopterin reductase-like flavin-dependent oxidoreductase (luciferase family) [Amycolatopsis arida]SFQ04697.1 Flavin-dependent oxidoreductase, luciferase family (includes alkanesulfonate monooxygenase SsuD and methylene tetrahydromethanopterin reductase) [Amycolatopsis arida]